jgi:hypothetical protein
VLGLWWQSHAHAVVGVMWGGIAIVMLSTSTLGARTARTRRRVFHLESIITQHLILNTFHIQASSAPQKCSTNANAPRTSSPRQPPHSPATTPAQSKPSTHPPKPSSRPSTLTNPPPSTLTRLHTSMSARENVTAIIVPTPTPSQHPRSNGYTKRNAKTQQQNRV